MSNNCSHRSSSVARHLCEYSLHSDFPPDSIRSCDSRCFDQFSIPSLYISTYQASVRLKRWIQESYSRTNVLWNNHEQKELRKESGNEYSMVTVTRTSNYKLILGSVQEWAHFVNFPTSPVAVDYYGTQPNQTIWQQNIYIVLIHTIPPLAQRPLWVETRQ